MAFPRKTNLVILTAAIAAILCCPSLSYANPEGASVVEGSAVISADANNPNILNINVASEKVVIDWSSFSIAANQIVNFFQPSQNSTALNRVTGNSISDIFGSLFANGRIILSNPNGINIGASANINAASFIASTLYIDKNDFMNGHYNFYKVAGKDGYIVNKGRITTNVAGGYICLLSPQIDNQYIVEANLGTVVLASGNKMTLALDDLNQISVVVAEAAQDGLVGADGKKVAIRNSGTITADGGKVIVTAKVLNNVFDYSFNNTGVIRAKSLANHDGKVSLEVEGAPALNIGKIEAGDVSIKAKGTSFINKGEVLSKSYLGLPYVSKINIEAATLIQDGLISAEKGTVTIDADTVKTTLDSSSTDPVNATTLVIRANQVSITTKDGGATGFPLPIDAPNIYFNQTLGNIDLLQSLGIGTSILLRGPPMAFGSILYNRNSNLTLKASSGSINIGSGVRLTSNNLTLLSKNGIYSLGSLITPNLLTLISDGVISSLGVLESSSLIERGSAFKVGGIFHPGQADVENADNAITYSANTNVSGTITDAANIIVDPGVILTMDADTAFVAGNAFIMDATSVINGGGYDLSISAKSASTLGNINNVDLLTLSSGSSSNVTFTSNASSTFQVNTVKTNYHAILSRSVGAGTLADPIMIYSVSNALGGLQYIPTSGLGLYYKLANNIDASETVSWNAGAGFSPVGTTLGNYDAPLTHPFTGSFNGNGYIITGLTINRPTGISPWGVGLFGAVGSAASISNVGLVNLNFTGYGTPYSGGLVGINYGTISNVYVTGSVTDGGGLAGCNYGTILNSYTKGTVTGSSSVGGLVGNNFTAGSIISSYSFSAVNGGPYLGGLVGSNDGNISSSYATGNVSGGAGSYFIGGLVGHAGSTSTISNSYATGTVNGSDYVGGLVGENYGTVTKSYATGTISGGSSIGGLVGKNYASSGIPGIISNSYATGIVSGSFNIGGLVGSNTGFITNSGWWTGAASQAIGSGGVITYNEATKAAFMNTSHGVYTAGSSTWDISNNTGHVWIMLGNPHLQAEWATTITNVYQLQMMAFNLSSIYTLANNIDASETINWNGGQGFIPVGSTAALFTGSFNGNFKTISGLYINRPSTDDVGLFGRVSTSANINYVGLENSNITGHYSVGSLVGRNFGNVSNSYVTGAVSGIWDIGGLVGLNLGTVSNSYAAGTVSGSDNSDSVGGLVGRNYLDGVSGHSGAISNSYAIAIVSAGVGSSHIGGLLGGNDGSGTVVSNSYATGNVSGGTGSSYIGGLMGYNSGTVANSGWWTGSSAAPIGNGGTVTYNEANKSAFMNASHGIYTVGLDPWDISNSAGHIWIMIGYPHLQMEWTTSISNVYQLQMMSLNLAAVYALANNIDASETVNWNGGQGFTPVGTWTTKFTGTFDGTNHTITGLNVNPISDEAGLFGCTGNDAVIKNVGLLNMAL